MHSLLRTTVLLKHKKEFFEKIYIDRKVVQEASAEIYFGTRVKETNRHRASVRFRKNQVLDYNNLGDSF